MADDKIGLTNRCRKCGLVKPASEFPPNRRARNRLHYRCRSCMVIDHREWRIKKRAERPPKLARIREKKRRLRSAAEKERAAEQMRLWRLKNPERSAAINRRHQKKYSAKRAKQAAEWRKRNRDRVAEYSTDYEAKRREKRIVYRRARYAADPEPARARARQWLRDNPLARKAARQLRRERKRRAVGSHTVAELMALLESQQHCCANPYCGADLRIIQKALDHKIALTRNGSNSIGNLQWLCVPCNARKSNLEITVWLERERLRVR